MRWMTLWLRANSKLLPRRVQSNFVPHLVNLKSQTWKEMPKIHFAKYLRVANIFGVCWMAKREHCSQRFLPIRLLIDFNARFWFGRVGVDWRRWRFLAE
jgi:hypothetical protein